MLSSRPLQIPLDGDSSSSAFAHARTPARALLKHRSGALRENAVYNGPMTVKGKGKNGMATPFNPAGKIPQTAIRIKTHATPSILVFKPLGDKTPFPNRQQPAAQQLRTPKPQATKLLLEVEGADAQLLPNTPECLLLPSATRRRRSLRLPSAISKSLKTPATKGNHWDVSDGDIDPEDGGEEDGEVGADGSQSKLGGARTDVTEAMDDDDEIEYMPPKLPEIPWTPSFDMPDYKTLGRTLLRVAHGERVDDTMDRFYSQDIEDQIDVQALLVDSGAFQSVKLALPELADDDPLSTTFLDTSRPRAGSASSSAQTNSRPGTAHSRPASQNSTHSRSTSTSKPELAAPRTRGRPVQSGTAQATAPKTVPTPTVTRRVQPFRAAAASHSSNSSMTDRATRSGTGTTAINTGVGLTTRGRVAREAVAGDQVKSSKTAVSRLGTSIPSRPRAAGPPPKNAVTRLVPAHAELLDEISDLANVRDAADDDFFFDA